jgi:predicted phosphohydrolase
MYFKKLYPEIIDPYDWITKELNRKYEDEHKQIWIEKETYEDLKELNLKPEEILKKEIKRTRRCLIRKIKKYINKLI